MTRGRRKDLSIPPSRALLQQRDYRARKAQYVADLEDRCRMTEQENAQLRQEVEALRARLASGHRDPPENGQASAVGPSPEVIAASSALMQHLTEAASSIARFQQVAFTSGAPQKQPVHAPHPPPQQSAVAYPSPPTAYTHTRMHAPPPPPPMHPSSHLTQHDAAHTNSATSSRPHARKELHAHPHYPHAHRRGSVPRSDYSESECCGGYLDCDGLVEDGEDELEDDTSHSSVAQRMSGVRSTASLSGGEDGRSG